MSDRTGRTRAVRRCGLGLEGAAVIPLTSGCGPAGILATATAIGVAQAVDIASIPYRMFAGAITFAIVNSI